MKKIFKWYVKLAMRLKNLCAILGSITAILYIDNIIIIYLLILNAYIYAIEEIRNQMLFFKNLKED